MTSDGLTELIGSDTWNQGARNQESGIESATQRRKWLPSPLAALRQHRPINPPPCDLAAPYFFSFALAAASLMYFSGSSLKASRQPEQQT